MPTTFYGYSHALSHSGIFDLRRVRVERGRDVAPPRETPTTRVMTFNLRYGTAKDGENHWEKRKDFLVDVIKTFDPDLLGTQETLAFQRDYVLEKLTAYEAFGVGRDDGTDKGEMAALFYKKDRFEKIDGGHFWLSETPDKVGSKGWDTSLPRLSTWVVLRDKKQPQAPEILFCNTHFDHIGKTARIESAKLTRTVLADKGKGRSIIQTGDFNSGEGSLRLRRVVRENPERRLADHRRVSRGASRTSEERRNRELVRRVAGRRRPDRLDRAQPRLGDRVDRDRSHGERGQNTVGSLSCRKCIALESDRVG
ncbi:MAG: endonuclease/exonuclease/phosphatase family protein [Pirellulales bacterium]